MKFLPDISNQHKKNYKNHAESKQKNKHMKQFEPKIEAIEGFAVSIQRAKGSTSLREKI